MPAKITRRIFLSGSAVAVAAPFVGPSILRAQDVNSKLNIACVGVGGSRGDRICRASWLVATISSLLPIPPDRAQPGQRSFSQRQGIQRFPQDV